MVNVETLIQSVMEFNPCLIVADRFRLPEVADAVSGRCRLLGRVTRWQESTADLQRCRQVGLDEGLSVAPESRRALRHALSESVVESDGAGNVRIDKMRADRSRQDVVQALVLACGRVPRAQGAAGPIHEVA